MNLQVVRAQTPEQFSRYRDLIIEYEQSLPVDLRHVEFIQELNDIGAHYGPPNAGFVAMLGETPAGCVALTRLDATTGIVKRMYVPPQHRGRGIARALMAALMEHARAVAIQRLVLDTARERLQAAYALYRSLGFCECAPYGEVDYGCPTFMELLLEA